MAAAARSEVAEALAPAPATDGRTVIRVGNRPVTGAVLPTRPPTTSPRTHVGGVDDRALDRWLAEFASSHPIVQPLHGDYYPGNVLVRNDQIVAVLDWDESFLGPAEVELATAAGEWGAVLARGDLSRARSFVREYGMAGGTAVQVDNEVLVQLY